MALMVLIAWALIQLGHMISVGTAEQAEMWRAVMIPELGIQRHLEPWGYCCNWRAGGGPGLD